MARPKKTDVLDLAHACDLTAGVIERLTCPADKTQAFLRDSKAPGLRVRVTAAGAKSFVFEAKLNRQTIRRTIGDVRTWPIDGDSDTPNARAEARRLAVMFDAGTDPREVERQREADKAARTAAAITQVQAAAIASVTVGEVWAAYLTERRPHWGDLHYADHIRFIKAGGVPAKRGTRGRGVTIAGPLFPMMALPLRDLDASTIEAWAAHEAKTRPSAAQRGPACMATVEGVFRLVLRTACLCCPAACKDPCQDNAKPRGLGHSWR